MHRLTNTLMLLLLFLLALVADVAAQVPDGLIGTWTLNMAKSQYVPGPPPYSQRTKEIDFTRDGLILVHTRTPDAREHRIGHWAAKLDGKDYPEFSRDYGAKPARLISIKSLDAYNIELVVKYPDGTVLSKRTWTLSKDGKTLTMTLKEATAPQGQPRKDVMVYDKQ